jgi:hypothetical protein
MLTTAERLLEFSGFSAGELPELLSGRTPAVLRGLVADWPVVQAGKGSSANLVSYLKGYCGNATVGAWLGEPEIGGRFFYNQDFSGFNFRAELMKLVNVLDELCRLESEAQPAAIYVGSTTIDTCLPGFRAANDLELGARQALASIWIGNRTRIAAHHDLPDNLACVVAGRRRFTLFPPQQINNLYIGPLDFTPAGQAISLVDFSAPDLLRFPRFSAALEHAQVVELEAGDAVFIPSMWWHHVEALDGINVLINYWWRQAPDYMDSPMNALMLALMTVRDLPEGERQAWRSMFDHYVFSNNDTTVNHIPEHARRLLAPLDAATARGLRARLLKKMNR